MSGFWEFDDDAWDAEILEMRNPTRWMLPELTDSMRIKPVPLREPKTGKFLPGPLRPCGTETRYGYHVSHGEPIDERCRKARNKARSERRRNAKSRSS